MTLSISDRRKWLDDGIALALMIDDQGVLPPTVAQDLAALYGKAWADDHATRRGR